MLSKRSDPRDAEQAAEIAPENQANVRVRVTAPNQLLGEIEEFLRMIEAVDASLSSSGNRVALGDEAAVAA